MPRSPGQDPGQKEPPIGFDWGAYVAGLVETHGTLAAVAARVAQERGFVEEVTTIERGLRRLRDRGHRDGGVWGRRVLRCFGLPRQVTARVRWMGQYHARFTDLPRSLCRELLELWDRPPVSASPARIWIQLGLASVALRGRDLERAAEHIEQARRTEARAETAARIELALVAGYVASRRARHEVAGYLATAESELSRAELPADDRACLVARWIDQRAYELNRPPGDRQPDPAAALTLYESIPTAEAPPFALCRRANGLAWCHFHLGNRQAAIAHAQNSVQHAGDGGSLRLRAMALNFLARVLPGSQGDDARQRALAIARRLEDEELRLRIQRPSSRG